MTQYSTSRNPKDHSVHGNPSNTYRAWVNMRHRCNTATYVDYHNYGGRGIKVCERWKTFKAFLKDMGPAPKGLQIDRIDNDGDYEPDNCRWATRLEQARNKRSNRRELANGVTQTMAEHAELTGLCKPTIYRRINRLGWSAEEALNTPPKIKVTKIAPKETHLLIKGEKMRQCDAARTYGLTSETITKRRNRGWTDEECILPRGTILKR